MAHDLLVMLFGFMIGVALMGAISMYILYQHDIKQRQAASEGDEA